MNSKNLLPLLLIVLITISSCSKDDLCIPEDAETPRLVIIFVDSDNILSRKSVDLLQVKELQSNEFVSLNDAGAINLTQVDSISIPLRIGSDHTQFQFIQSLNGNELTNTVDFTYTPEEVYINRACGFKAVFMDLNANLEDRSTNDSWIEMIIEREPRQVTTNSDIHVEIRH